MQTKNRIRSLFATLLSFLMALSLVISTLSAFLAFISYKPQFATAVAKKSHYASVVQQELKEEFISYGNASNIQESFFESFFETTLTEELVTRDVQSMLQNFFKGAEETVNTEQLEAALFAQLQKYAQEQGFHLDKTLTKNLADIAEELSAFYQDYLSILSDAYFKTASSMLLKFRTYLWYALIAGTGIFFAAACLIAMFYKKHSNRLRFCIYATSSAALMLLVAPVVLLCMGVANKINIGALSIYAFVSGLLKALFAGTALLSLFPATLTVFLTIGYCKAKQKENI